MADHRPLPDLMSEALGRVRLGPRPQVVSLPPSETGAGQALASRLKALGLAAGLELLLQAEEGLQGQRRDRGRLRRAGLVIPGQPEAT